MPEGTNAPEGAEAVDTPFQGCHAANCQLPGDFENVELQRLTLDFPADAGLSGEIPPPPPPPPHTHTRSVSSTHSVSSRSSGRGLDCNHSIAARKLHQNTHCNAHRQPLNNCRICTCLLPLGLPSYRGGDAAGLIFVLRSEDNSAWWKDGGGNFTVPIPTSSDGDEAAPGAAPARPRPASLLSASPTAVQTVLIMAMVAAAIVALGLGAPPFDHVAALLASLGLLQAKRNRDAFEHALASSCRSFALRTARREIARCTLVMVRAMGLQATWASWHASSWTSSSRSR